MILQLVNRDGVDPDLVEQLKIYELVLQHEDEGADVATLSGTVDNIRLICILCILSIYIEVCGLNNVRDELEIKISYTSIYLSV